MESITQAANAAILSPTQTRSTPTALTNKILFPSQNIYAGLANCIVEHLQKIGQQPKATPQFKANMRVVAKWLSQEETKDTKWLMMYGGTGTGKSTLLAAINDMITRLQVSEQWRKHARFSSRYITARALSEMFISDRSTFNGIRNYNLLMIDDLGTEPRAVMNYGNEYRPIVEMLTYRYENRYEKNLTTIFTTNIDPGQIGTFYDGRISSRVFETCVGVKFDGADFRQNVNWVQPVIGCPF